MVIINLFTVHGVSGLLSIKNGDFSLDELGENNISFNVSEWFESSVSSGNYNDFVFRHDRQFSTYAPVAAMANPAGYLYQEIGVMDDRLNSVAVEVDLYKRTIRNWGDLRVMLLTGDPGNVANGMDILDNGEMEIVGSYTFSLDNSPISSPTADVAFDMSTPVFDLSGYEPGLPLWIRMDAPAAYGNAATHFTNLRLHINANQTPVIHEFSVSRRHAVNPESEVLVEWSVQNTETIKIFKNGVELHRSDLLSGSIEIAAMVSSELGLVAENSMATRSSHQRINYLVGDKGPPNIILFHVDDMGWADWGQNGAATGSDLYQTPTMDTLAQRGVWFPEGYAPSPVCSPSRGALLSGKSPARTGLSNWIPGGSAHQGKSIREADWFRRLGLDEMNMAKSFNELGYRTIHIGKWHLGESTNAETDPLRHGFDVNIGGTDRGNPPTGFWPDDNGSFGLPGLDQGYSPNDYLTDVLTNKALLEIESAAISETPFFLHLSHYAVHTPIQAPAATVAKYQTIVDDGMSQNHKNAVYAAMVDHVDQSLDRTLELLRDLDILENTIVILISDNGGLLPITTNVPLRGGKGHDFEGGVRIPFVVSWPGNLTEGEVSEMPVVLMDIFPTLLDLVGAPEIFQDRHVFDGESIVAELSNPGLKERSNPVVLHYPHFSPQGGSPHSMVRDKDLKLLYFYNDSELKLFDLVQDPGETLNLWQDQKEDAERLFDHLARRLNHFNARFPSTHEGESLAPSAVIPLKDVFLPGWGHRWFNMISDQRTSEISYILDANYIFHPKDSTWIYLSSDSTYENAFMYDLALGYWIWSRYDIWPLAYNYKIDDWFQMSGDNSELISLQHKDL